tara:strand:- start:1608 stop:2936 length:1329 start_codon:yes stop_codon:yes gene_type:complete
MGWARSRINEALRQFDRKGHRRIARSMQMGLAIGDKMVGDHALRWAASLTFTTILSLMPLLVVVFSVLNAFLPGQLSQVQAWILGALFTDSISDITRHIEMALTANQGTISLVGLGLLLVVSILLFLSVENAFNDIWSVPKSRPMYRRLLTFYAVITLAPTFLALGSIFGSRLLDSVGITSLSIYLAGFVNWLLVVLALTLLYKLLPHTYVKMKYAFIAAVVAAIVFQLCRFGFNLYVDSIYTGSTRSKIYGSFALIPIFFLWVYLCWIIVLSGSSSTYIFQNRVRLTRDFDVIRHSGHELNSVPTGYLLCSIYLVIAKHFRRDGGDIEQWKIAHELRIDENSLEQCIGLLKSNDFICLVHNEGPPRLIPSKPLDRVFLGDIYALARHIGYCPDSLKIPGHDPHNQIELAAQTIAHETRNQINFAQLVDRVTEPAQSDLNES